MKRHRQGTEPREVPNPRDSPFRLHSTSRPVKNQIPIQARPEHLLRCKNTPATANRAACQRRGYARSVSAAAGEGEGEGEWGRGNGAGQPAVASGSAAAVQPLSNVKVRALPAGSWMRTKRALSVPACSTM